MNFIYQNIKNMYLIGIGEVSRKLESKQVKRIGLVFLACLFAIPTIAFFIFSVFYIVFLTSTLVYQIISSLILLAFLSNLIAKFIIYILDKYE